MNFKPADDAATAYTSTPISGPQTSRDIIYAVAQPTHRTGILEVLAQAFVDEPSTAYQSIGRPSYRHWYGFTEFYVDECTGAYSQHLVEAAGFTSVYEFAYADFLWQGKAIFRNVPAPHNKWAIYEKKLKPISK